MVGLCLVMGGNAVQLKVDIQMMAPEGTDGGAPQWQAPDWEGYPQRGFPGYLKTDKVWAKSAPCKEFKTLEKSSHDQTFPDFIERCQKNCMDKGHPPACSVIEATMGLSKRPQWMCVLKTCLFGTLPIWAPAPTQKRAGQWVGWQRVKEGHWGNTSSKLVPYK